MKLTRVTGQPLWEEEGLPPPPPRRGLRTGYTTGACAAASAKAATLALLEGRPVTQVTIRLPIGQTVTFPLHRCEVNGDEAYCSVIKDAGDDPDVTHGAEIGARVRRRAEPGLHITGGQGVGVVTRPGLGLPVGEPAINPVPRRMITYSVTEVVGDRLREEGLVVEVVVPKGEELAKKTMNGRLGILGGISILGTTGIVKPYSTAAYRASVAQGIDVAAAGGLRHVVLSFGERSDRYAQELLPHLPEMAFVEVGEFVGYALKRCVARRMERATLCGMIGKMSKVAQGYFMTHAAGSRVDPGFLADMARECGASPAVQREIREANTARHVQEIVLREGLSSFFYRLAQEVCRQSHLLVGGALAVDCLLVDFDQPLILGKAGQGKTLELGLGEHCGEERSE